MAFRIANADIILCQITNSTGDTSKLLKEKFAGIKNYPYF